MDKSIDKKTQKKEGLSNTTLLLMTLGLSIIYFVFSRFSNGFYMHDEVANFLGMQNFWFDPSTILGANSKTGYKLFYILPVLGGYVFLHFFNSLISALTVFFSYKILNIQGSKYAILIFFLLGIQPLWFMLSFRNYAEMFGAFLLVFGAYQHFNKKYIFAALVISYVAFTRTELHIVSGLYFLWLVFQKKWIPALLTGTFTVLSALIGFIMTGDVLHIVHDIQRVSESIKDAYPRQGFNHYILMSSIVFGAVNIVLFFNYLGCTILKKKKPLLEILVPTIIIFLLNCAFNAQFMKFGPSNGGNLRYLLVMAPFVSILAILSLDMLDDVKKRWKLLFFIIPLLILMGLFQTYDHNFIKFNEESRNWTTLIFALITSVLLILPLKPKQLIYSVIALSLGVSLSIIDTRQIQPEEETVKKAAKWFNQQLKLSKNPQPGKQILITEDSRLAVEHALFYFYSEKNKKDFKNPPVTLTKEATDTLKVGDIVVWESHYGYRPEIRPTSQPYDFYEKDPRFQKIQYYQSKDRRFTIVFFLKIKE